MDNNIEYKLPQNAYVNFDAVSLKSFMIEQINKGGVFTDQNYEGSNISSILDILAYFTHVLMFYLNQTSSESSFSQATIYENMNRIIKTLAYKPTGKQTSIVPINCKASSLLPQGNYTIKKFSYFLADNIQYTFNDDYTFVKATNEEEIIQGIGDNVVLYQGSVNEYPIYIAEGIEYETLPVVVENLVDTKTTKFISHGSLSVYVKEKNTNKWYHYREIDNLYLSTPTDRVCDIRLNELGNYEVKFGNGIFGRKLNNADEVSVFYIMSDGDRGLISNNTLNGKKLFTYNNSQYNKIYNDVNITDNVTFLSNTTSNFLTFNNTLNSSLITEAEDVEQIRQNVPLFLASQLRLVTESDYERFILKTIPNIVNDVKVVDNNRYINEYINYFYEICIDPNKVNRVILNQVNFADSCDFNNVNIFAVPTFELREDKQYPPFLSNSFKTLIKNITNDKKMISDEVVPRDPIYIAMDFGVTNGNISKSIADNTKLLIYRDQKSTVSKDFILKSVYDTILNNFITKNVKLGHTIDIIKITSELLSLNGVKNVRTYNTIENIYFNGVSFISWNPLFEGVDEQIINQNTTLSFFKFPYLYNTQSIANKIQVIDE